MSEKLIQERRPARQVARPRAQSLSTSVHISRRPYLSASGFTLKLGDAIGQDLTVIGHLSFGRIAELYQVWSMAYTCALTCKILFPDFGSRSPEARDFKREAMLLRRLKHPQVVRIFQEGNFAGRHYLVQEYLHGPSMFELIDRSPSRQLPVPDAIKTVIHVCSALDHLHAQGYIYRDMKPANILLRGGIPVLIDFDAAYRLRPGRRPGRSTGTDPYMAPELCLNLELSPATDVYGVGALLYEMLTGRWAYEEEYLNPNKQKSLEGRYPQVRGKPPLSPSGFNRRVSEELSSVVLCCLEYECRKRFQSVRELIRRLAGFLEGRDKMWPESVDLRDRLA